MYYADRIKTTCYIEMKSDKQKETASRWRPCGIGGMRFDYSV